MLAFLLPILYFLCLEIIPRKNTIPTEPTICKRLEIPPCETGGVATAPVSAAHPLGVFRLYALRSWLHHLAEHRSGNV